MTWETIRNNKLSCNQLQLYINDENFWFCFFLLFFFFISFPSISFHWPMKNDIPSNSVYYYFNCAKLPVNLAIKKTKKNEKRRKYKENMKKWWKKLERNGQIINWFTLIQWTLKCAELNKGPKRKGNLWKLSECFGFRKKEKMIFIKRKGNSVNNKVNKIWVKKRRNLWFQLNRKSE